MTEKEAQNILLGVSLKERLMPRIDEAMNDEKNVILWRGRMTFDFPMDRPVVTILLPPEE